MDYELNKLRMELRDTSNLISRLNRLQGPALVQEELSQLIREKLKSGERAVETSKTFVEDEENADVRRRQTIEILKLEEDVKRYNPLSVQSIINR